MITIKKLKKSFGGLIAVNDLSLDIKKGKITAIIGPNGSGKSTLFNLITGVLQQDKGKIYLGKQNISKLSVEERSKKGISRTYQNVRIFDNLSIEDHLHLALIHKEKLLPCLLKKEEILDKKIDDTLKLVGLSINKKTWARELSYGQKKLLTLATAIIYKHNILLLDEPVAGVHPTLRKKIKKILKNLGNQNETILIVEHDMGFVKNLADEIIVLDEGKLLARGPPKKVLNDPAVLEAYLGD
jgi:branched-chain amino acid transport system ATP-binding protein